MPATKDGRCWACVQRRRWYTEPVEIVERDDLRHLALAGSPLCELPRRGRSARPEAMREYRQRWVEKAKAADPEGWTRRRSEQSRAREQRKRYGMTPEAYELALAQQGGSCAICWTTEPGGKGGRYFHVDHDHASGAVRGLLCANCNLMLGHAKDSVAVLLAGAAYLSPEPVKAGVITLVRELATAGTL